MIRRLPTPIVFCAAATLSLLVLPSVVPSALAQEPNGCLSCHRDLPQEALASPTTLFVEEDVHHDRGFTCVSCHGGDPSTTDKAAAKRPASGYKGRPTGMQIVETCASCHSDAAFMRKYAPKQRVDQAAEYAASVHGQKLAEGDTNVATCVSCHATHGIRQVSDAKAPVFPLNVAGTCAECHDDQGRMGTYTLADGSPHPTNQHEEYRKSVHFTALTERNDLSAPTCNDCHGNHGAAPPGVGSVANVCGTCHAVFATKFASSTHAEIFERGCVECHGNHAVVEGRDEMLAATGDGVCGECHSEGDTGFAAAGSMRAGLEGLKSHVSRTEDAVAGLRNAGMEMSDQELLLGDARNQITLARTEIHTFDPGVLETVLAAGRQILAEVDQAAERATAELSFRRRGLAASLAAILLVVVALAFKIRRLDAAGMGESRYHM